MRFIKTAAVLLTVLSLAACAGQPKAVVQVQPVSFMSPIMYETFDCTQIGEEAKVLSSKISKASGVSQAKIGGQNFLIWPASLKLTGTGSQKTQFLKMKTQYEALERAAQREKCSIEFMRGTDGDHKSAQSGWVTSLS